MEQPSEGEQQQPTSGAIPAQPPLPHGPPPTQCHAQPQFSHPSHGYAAPACCSGFASQPYTQQQTWQHDGFVLHHNPDIPPISSMLIREAEAWRALLGLHASTVSAAQQLANPTEAGADVMLHYDEKASNSESREAAYCAALTGLASQCDGLVNEVLKLRTFRKARRTVEVQCVGEILRPHADEVLAIGQTLASNGALNVASVTTELRVAIQSQRNQISQLRVLLEAIKSARSLPLPKGGKLVLGMCSDTGETPELKDIDQVLKSVYSTSRELNETSLSDAITKLFVHEDQTDEKKRDTRQFARRSNDRIQEP